MPHVLERGSSLSYGRLLLKPNDDHSPLSTTKDHVVKQARTVIPDIVPGIIVPDDTEDDVSIVKKSQNTGKGFISKDDTYPVYKNHSLTDPINPNNMDFFVKIRSMKSPSFPIKLHEILYREEFHDVISWLPHGRSWRINNTKIFEHDVIPIFFRHCRLSSFMRQVSGWGFRRISKGPDTNSYYHELFLRGLPHISLKMPRVAGKPIPRQLKDSPDKPDFYHISKEFPLSEYAPTKQRPISKTFHNSAVNDRRPSCNINGYLLPIVHVPKARCTAISTMDNLRGLAVPMAHGPHHHDPTGLVIEKPLGLGVPLDHVPKTRNMTGLSLDNYIRQAIGRVPCPNNKTVFPVGNIHENAGPGIHIPSSTISNPTMFRNTIPAKPNVTLDNRNFLPSQVELVCQNSLRRKENDMRMLQCQQEMLLLQRQRFVAQHELAPSLPNLQATSVPGIISEICKERMELQKLLGLKFANGLQYQL